MQQKKYLGQHFLIDTKVAEEIVKILNPKIEQSILEIGPGTGFLTKRVCQRIKKLIAVEYDSDLSARLKKDIYFSKKLEVFNQDIMRFDFKKIFYSTKKCLRIFGNLPYNISTKIILYLLKDVNIISDMCFMLQKEVAHRIVAKHNSRYYGRLSIAIQYYCKAHLILDAIPPHSFSPIPKIESSVIILVPHAKLPNLVKDNDMLKYVVKIAFSQRRKKILNSLRHIIDPSALLKLNIDPESRAENISISQYCQLSNFLSEQA